MAFLLVVPLSKSSAKQKRVHILRPKIRDKADRRGRRSLRSDASVRIFANGENPATSYGIARRGCLLGQLDIVACAIFISTVITVHDLTC